MQCYHIYSETRGVYLTKNYYDSYSLKWYRWLKFVALAHGLFVNIMHNTILIHTILLSILQNVIQIISSSKSYDVPHLFLS